MSNPVNQEFETFLGLNAVIADPMMRGLMEHVRRVAQTDACVLITGESGSGKEMIARAVHHYSLRAHQPWVDINCGALPEHLIENELFGHDAGAFTGAERDKPGLFELAHNGSLFLDEIGEIDSRMQVKLLRVLDRIPYYRIGGRNKVSVDVRVMAATNCDLRDLVRQNQFRKDLYHRLNMVKIHVPPLRERPEDLRALAHYFLEKVAPSIEMSPEAISRLCAHNWPGNIRELRNVITSSAIAALGGRLEAEHLTFEQDGEAGTEGPPDLEVMSLVEIERRMIQKALRKTGGHQEQAAKLLGISSRSLHRKLKAYMLRSVNVNANAT